MKSSFTFLILALLLGVSFAAKAKKEADPKECEVCMANLNTIDKLIPSDKKKDKSAIEKAIGTHCTLSGFGSDWKPNPALTSPKDVKMCYIFEPIKKSISTPFSTGMPKKKVCERLKKENPEICEIKYRKFPLQHYYVKMEITSKPLSISSAKSGEERRGGYRLQ